MSELAGIEGFDDALAEELQNRAKAYLIVKQDSMEKKLSELDMDEALKSLDGLTLDLLVKLGENNIKTLDDFADLATDELIEIVGKNAMNEDQANKLIMKAREHWFE